MNPFNSFLCRMFFVFGLVAAMSCTRTMEVDVLIVGGGASGVAAGIQAARMEARTMIVEETPWLGGMLTSAGVSCIDGNYTLRGGIFREFTDSLASYYGGWDSLRTGWVSNINFEPNVGQEILSDMASACRDHLTVRRNTSVTEVAKDSTGWAVRTVDSRGRTNEIHCKVLIDATELGDVAKACGAGYRIGMEDRDVTGESIAPDSANDIIQDLTYVAILKDYGPDADMTIERPEGYEPSIFWNSAQNPHSTVAETGQTVWPASLMITYGALPNGKYMINWPIYGNDYYVNAIEMTPAQRAEAFAKAKNRTLCFIYFIQTELGMKHLGLADDVFPTEDRLPFFPYHRESRRIIGEAFFTLDAAADPYGFDKPYYRTGIAVGDYAVDHHHFRHPDWKNLPDLHFYPIPSYCLPAGVMLPKDVDDLIVTEKSISVSNLVNGTTRLQPVVMQIGQAAGAMAALAVRYDDRVKDVSLRYLQEELLSCGCYLMPYLDLEPGHRHFDALQRIGSTGIMRGEGRNVGWSNQTWFRADEPLLAEEMYMDEYFPGFELPQLSGQVTVGRLMDYAREVCDILGYIVPLTPKTYTTDMVWESIGLDSYDPSRIATRLEGAVVIDALVDPFAYHEIDFDGHFLPSPETEND